MNSGPQTAGLARRLAALAYESLILAALVFFATFAFHGAVTSTLEGWPRHLLQAYLFLVVGLYFVASWIRGGQTLPMKTWGLRITSAQGGAISVPRALARYLLAWISALALGTGFLWALFDRDGQFLHDRLAGTRIVRT